MNSSQEIVFYNHLINVVKYKFQDNPTRTYGGTEVTCVWFYLSRAHDFICRAHELLTRVHERLYCAYELLSRAHDIISQSENTKYIHESRNGYILLYFNKPKTRLHSDLYNVYYIVGLHTFRPLYCLLYSWATNIQTFILSTIQFGYKHSDLYTVYYIVGLPTVRPLSCRLCSWATNIQTFILSTL